MSCSSLRTKKTLNMRFTVYSLQFYTLRPIVMREQPVEKVQDSSLIEFLLKFFEAPSCLWLSFGSWSSFCNRVTLAVKVNIAGIAEILLKPATTRSQLPYVLFYFLLPSLRDANCLKQVGVQNRVLWGNPSRSRIKNQQSRNARFDWPQIGENTPLTGDRVRPKTDLRPQIRVKSE